MRKLLLLCGVFATACIDNDYDLANVSTDNIAIGDETSRFEAPLAKVYVSLADINSNDQVRIDQIFNEADTWLPTQLPDTDENGAYADVQRLLNDPTYVNDRLLPDLLDEMGTNPEKLDAVATLLQKNYYDDFAGVLPGVTQTEFKEAFVEAFTANSSLRDALSQEVKNLAGDYLTTLDVNMDDLAYEIGHIYLSDEVVNLLCDNVDPAESPDPKNTLHLAG